MEKQRIAVFDVCGTITRTNNTFDFIRFVLKADNALRYGLLMLIRVLAPFFNLFKIDRAVGRDVLRSWQIRLLRGYTVDQIREMSEQYVDHLFESDLLNHRVLEAMKRERESGRTILLVSSSIDPPITEIAKRLNVESYFASELKVEKGHYTGRLETDLLGHKESTLGTISRNVDLHDSSVYSDNLNDIGFMRHFGRRNAVINSHQMRDRWNATSESLDFTVNYDEERKDKDAGSINERTVKWTYVPLLYYVISRFHRKGVCLLFLREVVPFTLVGYVAANLGSLSFVIIPLSILMFYSVYEIGGLLNDLSAHREGDRERTSRISPGTRISTGVFIAIRLALVGTVLALLRVGVYPTLVYAGLLSLCLGIYLIHSMILSNLRIVTFVLLKICRSSIPLAILISRMPVVNLLQICLALFLVEAPPRVYWYCCRRGLAKGEISGLHIRCVNAMILCGLGGVVYRVNGSPYFLAIAAYFLALDGIGVLVAGDLKERLC